MKIQRALEIIKDEMPYESGVINEALNMVENALEKQIPKKLKPRGEFDPSGQYKRFCCPRCNKWQYTKVDGRIVAGIMSAYCPSCGQALDWNDLKGETK